MHAQIDHGQIGGTRLRLFSIGLHIAAYSSPRIHLVRKTNRQHEIVEGYAVQRTLWRAVSGIQLAACRRPRRHGRIVVRANVAQSRSRLLVLRNRSFQILVRNIDLLLQRVQLLVLKNLPPVPAQVLVIRLRGFPICHLFISGRNWDGGLFVLGPDGTAGKSECARKKQNEGNNLPHPAAQLAQTIHWGSPGSAAWTIVTSCPDTRESGGFKTTWSPAFKPATISIWSPKSWPGVTSVTETFPLLTTPTCSLSDRKIRALTGRR